MISILLSDLNNITAILSLVLGGLIFYKNYEKPINRTFFLLSVCLFFWTIGFSLEICATTKSEALIWNKILYAAAIFIPVLFFQLTANIVGRRKNFYYTIIFFYTFAIFLSFLNFTPFFTADLLPKGQFRYITVPGWGYYIYLVNYCTCFSLGLIILISSIFKEREPKKRIHLYLVLMASIIAILGASSTYILIFLKLNPIGSYFIFIYTLILAYSIAKQELWDIRIVIPRALASGSVLIMILTSIFFVQKYAENKIVFSFFMIIICLVWIFIANPLRKFLQSSIKRKFIKGYYDTEELLKTVSAQLSVEKNREEIFKGLEHELDEALQFDQIGFIIAVRKNNTLFKYAYYEKETPESTDYKIQDIARDAPIISALNNRTSLVFYKKLDPAVRESVNKIGCTKNTVFVPFTSPEMLEGILVLGERSGKIALAQRDLDFLKMLINMVNSLLYRLTPFEQIEKEFEANKQKLFEEREQRIRAEQIAGLARTSQECNHEIRTPASIIKMYTDDISSASSKEELDKFFIILKTQINRLFYVIDTTLGLTSEQQNKFMPINLNDVIDETFKLNPPIGYERIAKLTPVPNIYAAKPKIMNVILNLMDNAKKAMPNGGSLTIRTHYNENARQVILQISDTGTGIPPENLEKIWEPYFTTDKTNGHGLGLSFVHQIIQRHQGLIEVKSTVNQGTTFTIKFPTTRMNAEPAL